ncbi:MAG: hypothetical protein EXR04_06810, partial [Rhodospirillales bacterium]|nr:hypothetical protein [Rhodospirillales bacterium]
MSKTSTKFGVSFAIALLLSACIDPNQYALEIGSPPIENNKTIISMREMQSRNFNTLEKESLVQASAATLQDLGFTVGEVSKEYGILVGSKE